jgi:hypothetical protein
LLNQTGFIGKLLQSQHHLIINPLGAVEKIKTTV